MAAATKEVKWIIPLMADLGLEATKPIKFHCDSKAAIHIASNPVFHERTKHLGRDCHSVRDAVKAGLISMVHVRTKDQLANILTKTLGHLQFEALSSKLGIHNFHLRGSIRKANPIDKDYLCVYIYLLRKYVSIPFILGFRPYTSCIYSRLCS